MKYKNYFQFLLALSLFVVAPAAGYAADLVQFSTNGDNELITLTVPEISPHKVFTMANPDRLVVDVPAIPGKRELALPKSYSGELIKAMRYAWFDPKTSRFVFDLNGPVTVVNITEVGKKSLQLVLEIKAKDDGDAPPPPQPPKASKKTTSEKAALVAAPVAPQKQAFSPPKSTKDKKAKAAAKIEKPKLPLVAIDAGHGGVDPGTIGPDGVQEKDVVLEFAKALRSTLLESGKYRVIMTRSTDKFIKLRERVAIARKAKADLFISLHADSADELAARGLSVYTVSENASDKEAAALAARENKADVLAGMDLSDERQDVAGILISLAQRETKNNSATFADLLVRALDDKVRLLQNSHRFAGFAVLKAPDIPSVLVETGFLSHPQDEKMLKSKAYRDKVVAGIAEGIDDYFNLIKPDNDESSDGQ